MCTNVRPLPSMRVVCLTTDSVDRFTFGRVYCVYSGLECAYVFDNSGGGWHVRKDHKSGHWIISGRFAFAEVEE